MKKSLLTFLLIVLSNLIHGQTYEALLVNPSWNLGIANFGGQTDVVINQGTDVTVGTTTYKKFHDSYYNTDVYLREDVAARKVYKLVNNTEEMLYDFSLVQGDVITLSNGNTYTVNVSEVNVLGGTRKRITLQHQFFQGETWIEGVGSNRHPFVRTFQLPSDPHIYVTCSAQNGQNIYNHGIANGGTPTDCQMLLSTGQHEQAQASVYPNPFSSVLSLDLSQEVQNASVDIFDLQGKLVKRTHATGRLITVNRDGLSPGLYLLKVTETHHVVLTTKIVVAD